MTDPNVDAAVKEVMDNPTDLSSALDEAFNEASKTADTDKTAEAPKAENKDGDENAADKTADNSNAGDDDKPKNRVESLLADRNEAKTAAAEAQTEVQALTKQLADMAKTIEELKSGKTGEKAGSNTGADDSDEGKTVAQIVEETLAKREAAANASKDAEKSITDQIQALETNKQTPDAKEYADDLKALMAKHPTISAYAAYRMLQGEGIIPIGGANRSNANRTSTGNRSKTTLLNGKSANDMSSDEQFAFLKGAEKAGDLKGLI